MGRWLDALRKVGQVLLVLAVLELLVLAFTWGLWPATTAGWVLLLTVGPVVYLAWDIVGDLVLTPAFGYKLSRRRFSWLRVLILFGFALATIGVVVVLALLAGVRLTG